MCYLQLKCQFDTFLQRVAGNLRVNIYLTNIFTNTWQIFAQIKIRCSLMLVLQEIWGSRFPSHIPSDHFRSIYNQYIQIHIYHHPDQYHHDPHSNPPGDMLIIITVNDEYVKLLVAQPEGGSGGPEGTRRNEHGWPLVVNISYCHKMIRLQNDKMVELQQDEMRTRRNEHGWPLVINISYQWWNDKIAKCLNDRITPRQNEQGWPLVVINFMKLQKIKKAKKDKKIKKVKR